MKYKLIVVALAGALATAACSAANSSTAAGSATSGTAAVAAGKVTVGRFTFPSGAATGSPVTIGLVNSNNEIPQLAQAAQATAAYVNTHFDGIAGHKITLSVCDEKADPAAASLCTPQFLQDKVAAVTGFPLVWDAIGGLKGLAAANIPYVGFGNFGDTGANYYPMFSTSTIFDNVAEFKAQHIKSVNYLAVNLPAEVASANGIIKSVWAANGVAMNKAVFFTSGAADLTTPALQAVEGSPQAIVVNAGAADVVRLISAIRQEGYSGKIFANSSALTPQLYPAAAKVMTGVTAETDQLLYFENTTNPEVKLMSTILASSGLQPDSFSQVGVAEILTLADIGDTVGEDLTGAHVLSYLKTVKAQKVFMGYQMAVSEIPSNQPELAQVTDTFDRFMTYDGREWTYSSGWVSAFGTATPGVGAGS